ncbi:MAG TPA: ribosome-associated translation inhibitor RaiA [bacterium]|jgi:putative sigma-54 modulation protein|nr:ribosome-associated translation inhibitor RaiA [bacterium]
MQVQIKATGLTLTPAIREYIEEKIASLDKYLGDIAVTNCDFKIEMTTKHHNKGDIFLAEVNLAVPGDLLVIEKTEADLYKAIDKVKDHLLEAVKRYKDRRLEK